MADVYRPTVDEIRSILELAGEPAELTDVRPIRHGAVGALVEIQRRDGCPLVVKIYPDELSARMRTEAYVYRLLGGDGLVPVPRVLAADDSRAVLPLAYLLMTRLDGVRLADLTDRLAAEQGREVHRELGRILRQIHQIGFDTCGEIVGGELVDAGTSAEFLGAEFARQLDDFEAYGGPSDIGRSLRRYVARHEDALDIGAGGVLCHNDYVPGNIHVAEHDGGWRVTGVVDVERAIVADPLFDVARITRSETAWAAAFGESYGVRDGDRERLALYELYHALELWNWFAETAWTEQLPGLERELAAFAR